MLSIKSPSEVAFDLANKIRQLRLAKSWSRAELAERAGINVHTLKHFETTGQISLTRLLALCFVLGAINEFDSILQQQPPRTMEQFKASINPRQRGRPRKHAHD